MVMGNVVHENSITTVTLKIVKVKMVDYVDGW